IKHPLDSRCYHCYCYHPTTYLLFNSSLAKTNNVSYILATREWLWYGTRISGAVSRAPSAWTRKQRGHLRVQKRWCTRMIFPSAQLFLSSAVVQLANGVVIQT